MRCPAGPPRARPSGRAPPFAEQRADVFRNEAGNIEGVREASPVSGLAGDIAGYGAAALAAPATIAGGTGAVAGIGLLKPQEGSNYGEVLKKKAGQGIFDAALNAGVTKGIIGLGNMALQRIATKQANKTANSVINNSTTEALDAGMKIPRSLYNPTPTSNAIESFGGKAAVKQNAFRENQRPIDEIIKKGLGLPKDSPVDNLALDNLKKSVSAPYRQAEMLTDEIVGKSSTKSLATGQMIEKDIVKNGKQLVQEINEARDAWRALRQDAFSATGTSRNAARQAAKEAESRVTTLENQLDKMAMKQGNPELVKGLADARLKIKDIYDAKDALVEGTGSFNATIFGNKFAKNKLANAEFKQVGKFANAFKNRQIVPDGGVPKGEGVSALMGLGSIAAGSAGAYSTDSPFGLAASVLPFVTRGAARNAALSKFAQKVPTYNAPMMNFLTKGASLRNPSMAITGGASPQLREYNPFE